MSTSFWACKIMEFIKFKLIFTPWLRCVPFFFIFNCWLLSFYYTTKKTEGLVTVATHTGHNSLFNSSRFELFLCDAMCFRRCILHLIRQNSAHWLNIAAKTCTKFQGATGYYWWKLFARLSKAKCSQTPACQLIHIFPPQSHSVCWVCFVSLSDEV